MKHKKFISVVWGYHHQIFGFSQQSNYHMLPFEVMKDQGYNLEIFAIDSQVKIEEDPNFVDGTKVIYYKNIFQYLIYLIRNRNAIIYSNSLTIKTLLVGMIGKRTIFYPHAFPFGDSSFKKNIIEFFYRFFSKIRINNNDELKKIEDLRKGLGYICPLIIPGSFLNKNTNNREGGVFIGNLTAIKNPEILISVAKNFQDKGVYFPITIVGEDRFRKGGKSFQDLIDLAGLSEYISITGSISHKQVQKRLSQSVVYINNSISEGQCLGVYEGALAGCALCLPPILAFESVFGDNALYHNGEEDLINNIEILLSDVEKRKAMVDKNRDFILKNYSYDKIRKDMRKMFLSIKS